MEEIINSLFRLKKDLAVEILSVYSTDKDKYKILKENITKRIKELKKSGLTEIQTQNKAVKEFNVAIHTGLLTQNDFRNLIKSIYKEV